MRKIIYATGIEAEFPEPRTMAKIHDMIRAEVCGTVALKHMGAPLHVMILDDNGVDKNLPVNKAATELYLANCRPGVQASIFGDVFICPDDDFAG